MEQLIIIDETSSDPCISIFQYKDIIDVVVTNECIEVCVKGDGTTSIEHFGKKEEVFKRFHDHLLTNNKFFTL